MQYQRDTVLRLVGLVYDAALDPAGWASFLEALAQVVGGHAVHMGYVDLRKPELSVEHSVRWDRVALEEYRTHYARKDPWGLAAARLGVFKPGFVGIGEAAVPAAELAKTEFHNEYGRRLGIVGGVVGVVLHDRGAHAILGASRLPNRQYGRSEAELFTLLLPHLRRAVELHQRMTRLEGEREATAEAFHLLPMGLVLIDDRGDVALLNAAAEEIMTRRDGLTVMKRRLVAAVPAEGHALSRLIAEATSVTAGREIRGGGAIQVSRAGSKQPLTLLVTPLRSTNRYAPHGRAGAAIFITDRDRHTQTSHELLIQLHRLTPAESRLACLLAGGLTFAEALDLLGITANTGRGHLKHIFSKTDTRTQAQLVRLVLAMPATRRTV